VHNNIGFRVVTAMNHFRVDSWLLDRVYILLQLRNSIKSNCRVVVISNKPGQMRPLIVQIFLKCFFCYYDQFLKFNVTYESIIFRLTTQRVPQIGANAPKFLPPTPWAQLGLETAVTHAFLPCESRTRPWLVVCTCPRYEGVCPLIILYMKTIARSLNLINGTDQW
jgi:hypothetical protein